MPKNTPEIIAAIRALLDELQAEYNRTVETTRKIADRLERFEAEAKKEKPAKPKK
jgi:hypothetical protein